ncbi:MAG: single-stranded DNA-binding protein [Candidatus Pacebacteria bacterium]|nr:single-stranded DNA-binding protein [Candidatus Paceibacterota bacterium]
MKSITIAGGLTRDAVTRTTQGGDKITGFSVAVDEGFGDKKRTLYFECSLWGARGEKRAEYLTKGTKVAVSGDLSTREHDGKTYLTVRADQVTLMGGGQRGERREEPKGSGYGAGGRPGDDMDEIPF